MSERDFLINRKELARDLIACKLLCLFYKDLLSYIRCRNQGKKLITFLKVLRTLSSLQKKSLNRLLTDDLDDKLDLYKRKYNTYYDRNFVGKFPTTHSLPT